MTLKQEEKRWLEIECYLLCKKVYSINKSFEDIENFFKGMAWTNYYNYDIILETIKKENLLFNPKIIPSQYEFILKTITPSKKFKQTKTAIRTMITDEEFKYTKTRVYTVKMQEEVKDQPTILIPKIKNSQFHQAFYSFLLATQYMGRIYYKGTKL